MTAQTDGQVRIGSEFFAKVKLDYADWRWALVREFLQNCFDAPNCRNVAVSVTASGGCTVLSVSNDGAPMDRECLTTKLLTLGGSGKNFEGENTGGFGVAKSLLYYCHRSYDIRTGSLAVHGSGGSYTMSEGGHLVGTRSDVCLDGDEAEALRKAVRRFAGLSQWRGTLRLDGEVLATDLRKGARRRDLGWATVYTNNSASNLCVVRLNGQPMFTQYTRFKGTVLLELNGKAKDALTSNRDGLTRGKASELSDLLTALAVDKRSALREQRAEYKRWQGEVQRNEAKKPKEAELGLAAVIDVAQVAALVSGGSKRAEGIGQEQAPATAAEGGIRLVVQSKEDAPGTVSVGPQFILKNSAGVKAPCWMVPGERFSGTSRDLVRAWTGILLKLHQVCNRGGEFSVGFVLDEESEAEHERGVYGQVYYLNPAKVSADGKRSVSSRYAGAWQDRHTLISLALHEFVHGAYGLAEHDEDYAGKLTDVTATALRHAGELEDLCRPTKTGMAAAGTGIAPPVKQLNFRDRRIDCLGHASTSVLKWMGREGWSFASARDSMAELGCPVSDNTIRSCLRDGRQPVQRGTKVADLTADQVARLEDLRRRHS
jgi:hypothetical protein